MIFKPYAASKSGMSSRNLKENILKLKAVAEEVVENLKDINQFILNIHVLTRFVGDER